jgi:hypothetical protein
VAYAPNYQSLLDQAITLDNNIRKEENRKRKFSSSKTHVEPFHKMHHSSEGSGYGGSHKHGGHFSKGSGSNFNGHRHNGGFKGTTPMVTTMDTMVSISTTQKPTHTSPVSSARRLDTLQTIALR